MIVFTANGRCAKIKADEPITTGSVGMPVSVVLSGDFDGLAATMVFACGDVSADVALLGQEVTVPPQVLEEAGRVLEIGVYGARADGTIVIPTVWAKAGIVHEGVLPSGVDPAEPMPSWPAQVQQWAEDAHDTAERLAQEVDGWEADIESAVRGAENVDASVEKRGSTATVTVTDRNGIEHTATISDGTDGEDGYSPTVSIESTTSEHTITITDKDGEHPYTVDTYADEESARATAETERATAESARVTAESARVTAESGRATEWATIKPEAVSATQSASDAATAANAATTAATDAAALATRAAASTWNAGNVLKGTLAEGTVLTTDDAWAAPPESVGVYGVSTQASYTGKNLMNMAGYLVALNNDLYEPTETRYISEANGVYTFHSNSNDVGFDAPLGYLEAGTYRFSYVSISSGIGAYLIKYNDGFEPGQGKRGTNRPSIYTNIPVEITEAGNYGICFYVAGINNKTVTKPQFELGSTATDYEPYVGGKPAPSPDFPQPIESVDDLTLWLCGKNLMPQSSADQWLRSNGWEAYGTASNRHAFYVGPNEKFTLSVTIDQSLTTNTQNRIYVTGNANFLDLSDRTGRYSITGTAGDNGIGYVLLTTGFISDVNRGPHVIDIQLELGSTATAYEPYTAPTSVQIPLSNNSLRSLPDGTRDKLVLSYVAPSTEHDGWGVFGATLTQNIYDVTFDGNENWARKAKGNDPASGYYFAIDIDRNYPLIKGSLSASSGNQLWSHYVKDNPYDPTSASNTAWLLSNTDWNYNSIRVSMPSGVDTVDDFKAWLAENPVTVIYELRTPITHDLGTVELPVNPAPDLTAWADGGSAQPTMAMDYEQDINIVIGELRSAIADMATS